MKHSEQINEIATAMSKVIGQVSDPKKSTKGHGYKYATLSDVLSIVRDACSKNGIFFTQNSTVAQGKIVVTTMLVHSSGQWFSYSTILAFENLKTGSKMTGYQSAGGGITYARRYSLSSIFGIASEDDTDGVIEPKNNYNNNYNNNNYKNNNNYNNNYNNNKKTYYKKDAQTTQDNFATRVQNLIGKDATKMSIVKQLLVKHKVQTVTQIKDIFFAEFDKAYKELKNGTNIQ